MIWDNRLRRYAQLSPTEKKNLLNPFPKGYKPKTRPNKQENPFYRELLCTLLRLRKRISLTEQPQDKDFILFPEVFRDNRVRHLPNIIHLDFKKAGIFYDANVLRTPDETPPPRLKNFLGYLNFLSECHSISCISEESLEAFERHAAKTPRTRKIEVHHLPVDQPISTSKARVQQTPLVLFVSTLGYNKNHLNLMKAAEMLWAQGIRFELEFIGKADPSWTPKVLDALHLLSRKSRPIKWLRHVDQETLEKKYAECAFTVYPSLYEGFGMPILESLIRGKPCICGENGALGEVARGGGCLMLKDQRQPEILANSIKKLLSEPALLSKLKIEAKNRSYSNWKEYSSKLLTFISS
jgi:glycosyltransferase involved in cell wall biosynthesis